MGHDSSKVLMGTTQSSFRNVDNHAGDIPAGKIVRLNSSDVLTIAASGAAALGISLGKSLSDTSRTAICRKGVRVPVLVTDAFSPAVGAQVAIHDTTGIAATKDGSSTYVNAIYAEVGLTGILEDGTEAAVALIDMPGGL